MFKFIVGILTFFFLLDACFRFKLEMCPKDPDALHPAPPPSPLEKLKRKLPTPDLDGDGRTDRGNTVCLLYYHSSNGGA